MIFVTLGTQDKSFHRLLLEIEKMIDESIIDEKIIVQAGSTEFSSKHMEIFDFVDMDEFSQYVKQCDLLITHGGVGSILNGLNNGKKVIAVARLERYGEHENDHQLQIVSKFKDEKHIIGCLEVSDLKEAFVKVQTFEPHPYFSNNDNFCNLIQKLIED